MTRGDIQKYQLVRAFFFIPRGNLHGVARIAKVMRWFLHDAAEYAQSRNDSTFNLRMALGVARSLATSTRFVLDKELATNMFLCAQFLLRDVAGRGMSNPNAYTLMEEVLIG